ncbi:unnamed protein product [Trifolium pratense]|uniref:Uncharacterized protein n=1 Tax=Trifolium pratense TaxID=57577 RepID=A0ACB0J8D4_TRIPR|nr:unnamed protein product [Trifolium pratense]
MVVFMLFLFTCWLCFWFWFVVNGSLKVVIVMIEELERLKDDGCVVEDGERNTVNIKCKMNSDCPPYMCAYPLKAKCVAHKCTCKDMDDP